jgi:hypothetical protein
MTYPRGRTIINAADVGRFSRRLRTDEDVWARIGPCSILALARVQSGSYDGVRAIGMTFKPPEPAEALEVMTRWIAFVRAWGW